MRMLLTLAVLSFLLTACGGAESTNKRITYQNIVILSDMSSRLDNRPQKDIREIQKLIFFFEKECVMPSEKIGDKSAISFSVFSEETSAAIDLGLFKNLGEKQQFVNSTGKYEKNGLTYHMKMFEHTISSKYNSSRNQGLDLISILLEKIEKGSIIKRNVYLTDGIDTTFVNYENHLHIFTDGYLEYLNPGANRQFYFGISEIEQVRQYCIDHQVSIAEALQSNRSMRLPAVESKRNNVIYLHVHETHERDFDVRTQTYHHPKGLRDNEILQAVWETWATESGFKGFDWKKY